MSRAQTILVVEDEALVAACIRIFLESAGYNVLALASSVSEAERLLLSQAPDLVTLDYNLRDQCSDGLAKWLNQVRIPFIFLCSDPENAMMESGARPSGLLTKPATKVDLLRCVRSALAGTKMDNRFARQLSVYEEDGLDDVSHRSY